MGKYIDYYCENNCKKLIELVDKILTTRFGWIPQKDYDDFYSIAGQVLWRCEENFNIKEKTSFKTYFISCLIKKFKTRVTYCNRKKRKLRDSEGNILSDISINAIVDVDNGVELEDKLTDSTDLIDNLIPIQDRLSEKTQSYFSKLTKKQQSIALLIMENYTPAEIQNILHISNQKYQEQLAKMKSYENVVALF